MIIDMRVKRVSFEQLDGVITYRFPSRVMLALHGSKVMVGWCIVRALQRRWTLNKRGNLRKEKQNYSNYIS